MILLLSVFTWQSQIMQYQLLIQLIVVFIISFYVFKASLISRRQTLSPVILSINGEWLETDVEGQVAWNITDKSRVSALLLFIHLVVSNNIHQSKWCLVYKDQVSERDFRRLCRAIIYQQHTGTKSDI